MAARQSYVFGLPMADSAARVAIGHQYVQARFTLGQHAFMALAQLPQWLLVVRRDHGYPGQLIVKGFLQAPVVDQFTAYQLGCDRSGVGTKAVVISRQVPDAGDWRRSCASCHQCLH